jgi:hypothetical protein
MLSALLTGYPLLPGIFLVLIFVRGYINPRVIVWLEGLGQLKNPMTSSGIETATFRIVAYCLNQLRYRIRNKNASLSVTFSDRQLIHKTIRTNLSYQYGTYILLQACPLRFPYQKLAYDKAGTMSASFTEGSLITLNRVCVPLSSAVLSNTFTQWHIASSLVLTTILQGSH